MGSLRQVGLEELCKVLKNWDLALGSQTQSLQMTTSLNKTMVPQKRQSFITLVATTFKLSNGLAKTTINSQKHLPNDCFKPRTFLPALWLVSCPSCICSMSQRRDPLLQQAPLMDFLTASAICGFTSLTCSFPGVKRSGKLQQVYPFHESYAVCKHWACLKAKCSYSSH